MNTNKDIWSYGAVIDDEFYGPLEFLELDEVHELLESNGYIVNLDDPENAEFTLPSGDVVDIEGFTASAKPLLHDNGFFWNHTDNM